MEGQPKVQMLMGLMSLAGPSSSSRARRWCRLMSEMRLNSRKEMSSSYSPSSASFSTGGRVLFRMICKSPSRISSSFLVSPMTKRQNAMDITARG